MIKLPIAETKPKSAMAFSVLALIEEWAGDIIAGRTPPRKYRGAKYLGTSYWTRGNVLFSGSIALARVEPTLQGGHILLCCLEGATFSLPIPALVPLPVGATTASQLRGDELHALIRQHVVGLCEELLTDVRRDPGSIEIVDDRAAAATEFIDGFEIYRHGLAPHLDALPDYAIMIRQRHAVFIRPDSVERRERNAARRIAKKAFGLEFGAVA